MPTQTQKLITKKAKLVLFSFHKQLTYIKPTQKYRKHTDNK